ncbi:hypothetical protein J2T60_001731 [Natronospira proteinivora]|uniref:Beta-ketoacyl synthase-like N-terminal domain-containing protein n=1 Tax=Natronospira proteinivora TaxID=1807133 RepID=A0ABT1G8T8_9GAMM|nr:beta-ketoacyl synthase chain length factor [Natronospira proteinivora]MCP1727731.1 hypothetical protein [Natronospira proteinivora]
MNNNSTEIDFRLRDWQAWAPGMSSHKDWLAWIERGGPPAGEERADVSFLPAMQRRRLGPMARMVFRVMEDTLHDADDHAPMVFASRHGELARSYSLLQSLAEGEPLSPRDFSLSVHNAILGLHSIARKNREPATAVAAGLDTLPAGLLETAVQAAVSQRDCLMVWAEQSIPAFYRHYLPEDAPVACLALRVAPKEDTQAGPLFRLAWRAVPPGDPAGETAVLQSMLTGLVRPQGRGDWRSERRAWQLEPVHVAA